MKKCKKAEDESELSWLSEEALLDLIMQRVGEVGKCGTVDG